MIVFNLQRAVICARIHTDCMGNLLTCVQIVLEEAQDYKFEHVASGEVVIYRSNKPCVSLFSDGRNEDVGGMNCFA